MPLYVSISASHLLGWGEVAGLKGIYQQSNYPLHHMHRVHLHASCRRREETRNPI